MFHFVEVPADDVADKWRDILPARGVGHWKAAFFGVQHRGFGPLDLPRTHVLVMAVQRRSVARTGYHFHAAGMFPACAHEGQPEGFQ